MKCFVSFLLFFYSFLNVFSQSDSVINSSINSIEVKSYVDSTFSFQAPLFPVCELKKDFSDACFIQQVHEFVRKNVKYPMSAIENEVEGVVYVKFTISSTGEVTNVSVRPGATKYGHGLEEEAIRVISKLPKLTPAHKNNKPISANYVIPIRFALL